MGYDVKNGQVVNNNNGPNDGGDPQRPKPFDIAELFAKAIPNGASTDDVMHALNLLMGEAVARRGQNLPERKRIAEAFHTGLLRSLELNSIVESRVTAIKAKLRAEGKEPSQEEFRAMIASEMKQAADEMRNVAASRPADGGLGIGLGEGTIHDVGVSEAAAPADATGGKLQ